MPSRPVALFEGIFLRSASTISLVIGRIQNLSCDEGGIWLLTKFCKRTSSSDCEVAKFSLSGGTIVALVEVKYSLNASAIFTGSITCLPLTEITLGAFELDLVGAECFNNFHGFLVLSLFSTIFSLK